MHGIICTSRVVMDWLAKKHETVYDGGFMVEVMLNS